MGLLLNPMNLVGWLNYVGVDKENSAGQKGEAWTSLLNIENSK